jgi:hypothetical protein
MGRKATEDVPEICEGIDVVVFARELRGQPDFQFKLKIGVTPNASPFRSSTVQRFQVAGSGNIAS